MVVSSWYGKEQHEIMLLCWRYLFVYQWLVHGNKWPVSLKCIQRNMTRLFYKSHALRPPFTRVFHRCQSFSSWFGSFRCHLHYCFKDCNFFLEAIARNSVLAVQIPNLLALSLRSTCFNFHLPFQYQELTT